jgi:hypothetical protein
VITVISNAELCVDEFGDPGRRPEIGPVAVRHRTLEQELDEPAALAAVEPWGPPRCGLRLQAFLAVSVAGITPAHDGTCEATDPPRHFIEREALVEQLQCPPAPLLKELG